MIEAQVGFFCGQSKQTLFGAWDLRDFRMVWICSMEGRSEFDAIFLFFLFDYVLIML